MSQPATRLRHLLYLSPFSGRVVLCRDLKCTCGELWLRYVLVLIPPISPAFELAEALADTLRELGLKARLKLKEEAVIKIPLKGAVRGGFLDPEFYFDEEEFKTGTTAAMLLSKAEEVVHAEASCR